MPRDVFRICPRASWERACTVGHYDGEPLDLRDGFLHLSAAEQVAATLDKHFPGRTDLVLLRLSADGLAPALRWEASRGGELFPHLYAQLLPDQALAVYELPLDDRGRHRLPEQLLG